MGEEELGGFIWLVCHFLPLMIEAGGRVIQGYHTEVRRIRWGKVLLYLQRVYASQRSDYQLKHRWADLITREQDLFDHLGIVIGGPVNHYMMQKMSAGFTSIDYSKVAQTYVSCESAANMTPDQVREFQRRAMRYQHILLVESGFRRMAHRCRHERAFGAWRAFPQGGPTLPITATTSTTTTSSQVAPPTAGTVVPTSAGLPGPSIATGAGQPTGLGYTHTQTSSTGTQTAPAPSVDPAAFHNMERKMDRVLRKLSHLSRDVRHINWRVKSIKRTLRRANL
ncbi:hypothetical protein NDU88_010486 [Pleurodeles waltl]|uniref:Uncharacterized protein n=1 Tax=Pleurodeles waltl TaxID=8319 RepID=A0AAV7S1D7_PLEWA|nr:hypothetical protein NDU88_010486 [Pleurodeles waltl]